MVVCKYFLQGTCRFGNNCNFDHPRDQKNYGGYNQANQNQFRISNSNSNLNQNQNQYKYVAQNHQPQVPNKFAQLVSKVSSPPKVDVDNITNNEEFLESIRSDFSEWLNSSSLWKFSTFSYKKSAPSISILQDLSPEEVRYNMYEAKKNNNLSNAIQEFQQKKNQIVDTIKQMINPNQQARDYLIKYFEDSERASKQKTAENKNPFMQIIQNKQHEAQNNFQLQDLTNFNQPSSQNHFLQTQNLNPFHQQQQNQNKFPYQQQQTSFNLNSNFPNNNNTSNLFSQLISKPPEIVSPHSSFNLQTSVFQQNNNRSLVDNSIFGNNQPNTSSTNGIFPPKNSLTENVSILPFYSNPNELSEQDMDEFNSSSFSLGKIPRNPPPQNLC